MLTWYKFATLSAAPIRLIILYSYMNFKCSIPEKKIDQIDVELQINFVNLRQKMSEVAGSWVEAM